MSYRFFDEKVLDLPSQAQYPKAYIGLNFIAFLNNSYDLVMAIEDKEAVQELENIYRKKVQKLTSFPVYDGKTFSLTSASSLTAFKEVLGLPEALTDKLDFAKDITSQITFVNDLSELKREVYSFISDEYDVHYYADYFKLYLLNHGVYFPQEETKPFIDDKSLFPVFIDREKLPADLKERVSDCNFESLLIDFPSDGLIDESKLSYEKFDAFSLEERVDYFINNRFDKKLADKVASKEEKENYAYLLRNFVASLVNSLFDKFSLEVLHKLTAKLSFLTPSTIEVERKYYVLSSFGGEMFSLNGNNYYFNRDDYDSIYENVKRAYKHIENKNPLLIYAYLKLPYEGYKALKDKDLTTPEKFMEALPFLEGISKTSSYLAPKRFDSSYSYLADEKEHKHVFLLRKLADQGIEYISSSSLLNYDAKDNITILISDEKREGELASIFSSKCALASEIYPSYQIQNKDVVSYEFLRKIQKIDSASDETFCSYFYSSFYDRSLEEVLKSALEYFNLSKLYDSQLLSFFKYVLFYPFKVVESQYRYQCLAAGDKLSLSAFDGHKNKDESYEPGLVYPYVYYGNQYYSFRKKYNSTPYLCSCQKESIESTIDFFSKRLDKKSLGEKGFNEALIPHLGLPDNVVSCINLNKPLLPQLKFKDHICHLCQKATPAVFHSVFPEEEFNSVNAFSTYERSISAKRGMYQTLYTEVDIANGKAPIIYFDKDKVDKSILPYLDTHADSLVTMLCCFLPGDSYYQEYTEFLYDFSKKSQGEIEEVLNGEVDFSSSSWTKYRPIASPLYRGLFNFRRLIQYAYMIEASKQEIPFLNSNICLNDDYNANLPLPYVYLGSTFNAYAESKDGEPYFCSCDKDAIQNLVSYFLNSLNPMDDEILTPVVLGLAGLPFRVVYKYRNYSFRTHSVADFMSSLKFKDHICRRCKSINHAAYLSFFIKAYPFKDDESAEYSFARNALAHRGIAILTSHPLIAISFKKGHFYDLDSYDDAFLPPLFATSNDNSFYSFFTFDSKQLKSYLYEYSLLYQNDELVNMLSDRIIKKQDVRKDIFYQMLAEWLIDKTLREKILMFFPELESETWHLTDALIECFLGFISFLISKLISKFAVLEHNIGR